MISIVITAYKEANTIGKAITCQKNKPTDFSEHSQKPKHKLRRFLIKQKIKNYELIVSAPDDETLNVARSYAKKNKKIKILKDKGNGKPAALNLVFKKAKGEILILTDGDVYISDNSINSILEKFKDKKVGIVSGRPISLNDKRTMLGFWSHLLTDTAHKLRKERTEQGKMIVCSGYLYAFRKNLIRKIPEEALSEDAVISHLIADKGYKTEYAKKAEVYVKYPLTFKDWIKQKKRSAGGYNQLAYMVRGKERMRSSWLWWAS